MVLKEGKLVCNVTCDLNHCVQTGRLMSGDKGSKLLPLKGNGGYSNCLLFLSVWRNNFSGPIFLHAIPFENTL